LRLCGWSGSALVLSIRSSVISANFSYYLGSHSDPEPEIDLPRCSLSRLGPLFARKLRLNFPSAACPSTAILFRAAVAAALLCRRQPACLADKLDVGRASCLPFAVAALPDGGFVRQIWKYLADLKVNWQAKYISGRLLFSGGFLADFDSFHQDNFCLEDLADFWLFLTEFGFLSFYLSAL
jgi:hypothetical protein